MSNQNSNSSTIVANCLECSGLVRVPVDAPSDSMVRCPHCQTSFALSEILGDAIPEVEVVDASETPSESNVPHVDKVLSQRNEEGELKKFVVPPQLSKGAQRPGRTRSSNESSQSSPSDETYVSTDEPTIASAPDNHNSFFDPGVQVDTGSYDSPTSAPAIQEDVSPNRGERRSRRESRSNRSGSRRSSSSRRRSSSRKPAKGPNPTIEFLKVVFGGVLAIPIAYLIVLLAFKQDPLSLAPSISKVAPFLVPESLRPAETEDEDSNTPGSNAPENDTGAGPIVNMDELPIPKLNPDNIGRN